jgi:hypothetical protein
MAFLTVFSAPKPFTNPHVALIQRNAIESWLHLGQDVEVFLVGEEEGTARVAAECGVTLLANVQRSESGTPLVSSIFELARQASDSPYLAYVNGDILLLPDILAATRQIASRLLSKESPENGSQSSDQTCPPFLLIGQRWDLDVTEPLDFSVGWDVRLRRRVNSQGQLHAPAGSDYFVFPRLAFTEMPAFAIGRAGWDNWMIFHARQQGWPVIDGTPSLMVIHQSHDYSHLPGGLPHYNHEESQHNMQIGGGLKHMYMVLDADKQLIDGSIRQPRFSWLRFIRSVERGLMPENGELRGPRGELTRRLRKLRRKLGKEL